MATQSAGLLVYRQRAGRVEVFLVHPGGPFWQRRDVGAWSIPKGICAEGENPLDAAQREFTEETGQRIDGPFTPLVPIRQRGGKVVNAWIAVGDFSASQVTSNTFTMEWPQGSGVVREFAEVDRGEWFDLETAQRKINPGQQALLRQLRAHLSVEQ
jgi:predicted NUDIX family NTP pyrophosphohydrolase